jgi:iron(III) transport system permease protein
LGLLLAWPAARRGGWAALPALVVAAVLPAVAGPAIGLALETALNQPGYPLLNVLYDRTIAAPAIAQTIRALPPATLILWYGLCGMSRDLLDMAAVDGAGPVARLVRVVLPARWPALALAWLVALAVALGELSATILVLPPGVGTIGVEIFRLLHWSAEDLVAGICLFLWAAVAVVGGVAAWFSSRSR